MNMRDEFAARIMSGICAGDWKFEIPEGKAWDVIAVRRAYDIADKMIKEREINTVQEADFVKNAKIRFFSGEE